MVKFSYWCLDLIPLNIHWFVNSGLENLPKIHFIYKKEQTFWGLKGLVLEDTPVNKGSC